MQTINIHEAKTHLSRFIQRVMAGECLIIARSGKPIAKLVPFDTPEPEQKRRIGFMAGRCLIPDDFDQMDAEGIAHLFQGDDQVL